MEKAGDILKRLEGQGTGLVVSKRQLGRIEAISMARMADGAPAPIRLVPPFRPTTAR